MDGVDYRVYNWGVSTNTMGSELFFFIIIYIKRDWRFYGYLDRIQDRQIYLTSITFPLIILVTNSSIYENRIENKKRIVAFSQSFNLSSY